MADHTSQIAADTGEAVQPPAIKRRHSSARRVCDPVTVARLREQGFTRPEIAKMLGVSGSTVARALREVPAEKPSFPDDPRDPSAVATLRGLLLSASETVRLRAAMALLSNSERVNDAELIQPGEAEQPEEEGWLRIPIRPVVIDG